MARRNRPKYRDPVKTREDVPKTHTTKEGVQLLCPFCDPSHPILPGQDTPCGTTLKVTAVQQVVVARVVRHERLVCLKCKEGDGEMVKFMNGFVHTDNCAPHVKLMSEVPKHSEIAKFIHSLPTFARAIIEKLTGVVKTVKEIDPDGKETGHIQSYFFLPKKA